jgi:hypothetical protein
MNARQRNLAVVLVALVALSACASMPPDRIAYNSIDGAKAGVVSAVKAWGDLYQQGKYTDADREKVKKAYEKFEAALAVAVDIARTATNEEQKKNALAYVNAAASDIMRLLREFEVVK